MSYRCCHSVSFYPVVFSAVVNCWKVLLQYRSGSESLSWYPAAAVAGTDIAAACGAGAQGSYSEATAAGA